MPDFEAVSLTQAWRCCCCEVQITRWCPSEKLKKNFLIKNDQKTLLNLPYRRIRCKTRRNLLLLSQIPNLDLSTQISESTEQHKITEVIEINAISNASSEIKDRIALEVEECRFGGNVSVNDDELIGLWAPGDSVDWSFSGWENVKTVNKRSEKLFSATYSMEPSMNHRLPQGNATTVCHSTKLQCYQRPLTSESSILFLSCSTSSQLCQLEKSFSMRLDLIQDWDT